MSHTSMIFCPPELRERYRAGRVIPFVGAGASMSVKWTDRDGTEMHGPSWARLVEEACTLLGFESADLARVRGTDLQVLEYFKLRHSDQIAKLTNWLSRMMRPEDADLEASPIHTALAGLLRCNAIYTTNFDDFIERAFAIRARPYSVVAVEEQLGRGAGGCEIIKLHGDLDHPQEIVLTESDYERRMALTAPLDHRLRADLLGRVTLFIGYSFRDPNVSYLFRLFMDSVTGRAGTLRGDRAYIVVADPSDFEYRLFEARRIRVIRVSGQSLTKDTAALLQEMGS